MHGGKQIRQAALQLPVNDAMIMLRRFCRNHLPTRKGERDALKMEANYSMLFEAVSQSCALCD